MHGAFYTFRREAWVPAASDTINDDFEMPIGILRRGWEVRCGVDKNAPSLNVENKRFVTGINDVERSPDRHDGAYCLTQWTDRFF